MRISIALLFLLAAGASAQQRTTSRSELWAFTGPWDAHSDSSLRANASRMDVAITGWIGLDSATGQPILPGAFLDTAHLSRGNPRRMAIVTSWQVDRFHPSAVRALAKDDARLARAASALAKHAATMRYAGLVLDLEALERSDLPSLLRVVRAITDSAHRHGVSQIVVAIPAADSAAYPAKPIANVADLVMPMLYDEHWSTSGPGAIASPEWVRATLAARVAEVGGSKILAALPLYGYRWTKPGKAAEVVSYTDAKRIAEQARVPLARDPRTSTLRASKPGEWELWVADSELLGALERQVRDAGVNRVALWRIGGEDSRIWSSLVP